MLVPNENSASRPSAAAKPRRSWIMPAAVAAMLLPASLAALFSGIDVIDRSARIGTLVATPAATPTAADPGSTILAVGPEGHDVRLAGELTEGVARRLAALLDRHPGVTRIHLTSEGGLADEGQALGDVIADHHLTTFVPDYCVSACTLALVRGRERLMLPEARIGFHAPYRLGPAGTMEREDASEERAAYLAAGVSADFVAAALDVDPADIWLPTYDELVAARVVTAAVDRHALPDSTLDDAPTLDGARASILRNFPILTVLREGSPRAVDLIAAWHLDSYRRGCSEGDNVGALQAVVGGAVALSVSQADDATMLELVRSIAKALDATRETAACATLGNDMNVVAADERLKAGGTRAAALLRHALVHPAAAAHEADASSAARWADAAPTRTCAAWRRLYAGLLLQPPAHAAATVRARLAAIAARDLIVARTRAPSRDGVALRAAQPLTQTISAPGPPRQAEIQPW